MQKTEQLEGWQILFELVIGVSPATLVCLGGAFDLHRYTRF